MSKLWPEISILLTTYNHEEFISQAVESIFYQDYPGKIQVVVADDCSTDATVAIIRDYARKQDRIEFEFLDSYGNLGITRNYQRGFAACTRQYIAVLEGDDWWASTQKLSKQIEFLEEHMECVACACNYYIHDQSKCAYELRVPQSAGYIFITARSLILDNLPGNFSTCVYRRSALLELPVRLFSVTAWDWAINIFVCMHGVIGFLGEPLSVYRIHSRGAYNHSSLREKLEGQLALSEVYDELTGGIFHAEFHELRSRLARSLVYTYGLTWPSLVVGGTAARKFAGLYLKQMLIAISPPIVLWLVKAVLPPALLHRLLVARK